MVIGLMEAKVEREESKCENKLPGQNTSTNLMICFSFFSSGGNIFYSGNRNGHSGGKAYDKTNKSRAYFSKELLQQIVNLTLLSTGLH